MSRQPLTGADFARADAMLQAPAGAVRAVCEVEAPLGGFDAAGLPRILFEGHHFSRRTGGQYDAAHPSISYPRWTRAHYARGSNPDARNAGEHQRLAAAVRLAGDAALASASWGRFQIMGSNHAQAGHGTLQAFVNAMYRSEAAHLDAFCHFVRAHPAMHHALRTLDWTAFARAYNGPRFAENSYDTKLAAAYRKWQRNSAPELQPLPPAPAEPKKPEGPANEKIPHPFTGLSNFFRLLLAFFQRKKT